MNRKTFILLFVFTLSFSFNLFLAEKSEALSFVFVRDNTGKVTEKVYFDELSFTKIVKLRFFCAIRKMTGGGECFMTLNNTFEQDTGGLVEGSRDFTGSSSLPVLITGDRQGQQNPILVGTSTVNVPPVLKGQPVQFVATKDLQTVDTTPTKPVEQPKKVEQPKVIEKPAEKSIEKPILTAPALPPEKVIVYQVVVHSVTRPAQDANLTNQTLLNLFDCKAPVSKIIYNSMAYSFECRASASVKSSDGQIIYPPAPVATTTPVTATQPSSNDQNQPVPLVTKAPVPDSIVPAPIPTNVLDISIFDMFTNQIYELKAYILLLLLMNLGFYYYYWYRHKGRL